MEKGKDSQLGVPRRQVAYKPVSHQAVEEHRWTACKTPGAQVFSREGSWLSPYTCVATACASFATTPHLNSAFLPAGLPACATKVLPQGCEATHLHLIVWFSASPTIQLFLMDTFPPFPPYTFLLSQRPIPQLLVSSIQGPIPQFLVFDPMGEHPPFPSSLWNSKRVLLSPRPKTGSFPQKMLSKLRVFPLPVFVLGVLPMVTDLLSTTQCEGGGIISNLISQIKT